MGKQRKKIKGPWPLVLDLAKAFERVSLLVVWECATHFTFPTKILRVLFGYFEHERRVQFEGSVAEPFRTFTTISAGSKWSCLLLTKIYPPLKLRASFVDDITALLVGKIRKWQQWQKKVMKKVKEEVEKKGIKLSITENGNDGKSQMIGSCGSWRTSCVKPAKNKE